MIAGLTSLALAIFLLGIAVGLSIARAVFRPVLRQAERAASLVESAQDQHTILLDALGIVAEEFPVKVAEALIVARAKVESS